MYSHCLYCTHPFGANEVLEHFPVGRRLAFDQSNGRLWVICLACRRWCLSPLEERWEAIEEAERIVVDARGIPIRIAPGELVALFGATQSSVTGGTTGADAERAAHAALALVAKLGGRAGIDTTRIVRRPRDTSLAGPESAAVAAALAREAHAGEVRASPPTARQVSATDEVSWPQERAPPPRTPLTARATAPAVDQRLPGLLTRLRVRPACVPHRGR
jgi:hypothetical protein